MPKDGIISFAYLFKKLTFEHPFTPKKVNFNEKLVKGFSAKVLKQKEQILVKDYQNKTTFWSDYSVKVTKIKFIF